jgi:hypothetical protein
MASPPERVARSRVGLREAAENGAIESMATTFLIEDRPLINPALGWDSEPCSGPWGVLHSHPGAASDKKIRVEVAKRVENRSLGTTQRFVRIRGISSKGMLWSSPINVEARKPLTVIQIEENHEKPLRWQFAA